MNQFLRQAAVFYTVVFWSKRLCNVSQRVAHGLLCQRTWTIFEMRIYDSGIRLPIAESLFTSDFGVILRHYNNIGLSKCFRNYNRTELEKQES